MFLNFKVEIECVECICMEIHMHIHTFPRWLSGKDFICQCRRYALIPGSESSPGEGNGNPLRYFYLENPMDRGTWWATYSLLGHKVLDTQLSIGFSRQEYWVGCCFLLQGIFPTKRLNLDLLHCKWILYHLSQQGTLGQE